MRKSSQNGMDPAQGGDELAGFALPWRGEIAGFLRKPETFTERSGRKEGLSNTISSNEGGEM